MDGATTETVRRTFTSAAYLSGLLAEMDAAQISLRIRHARRNAGFRSREQLADVLQVHVRTIENWENPKNPNVPYDRMQELADVLTSTSDGCFTVIQNHCQQRARRSWTRFSAALQNSKRRSPVQWRRRPRLCDFCSKQAHKGLQLVDSGDERRLVAASGFDGALLCSWCWCRRARSASPRTWDSRPSCGHHPSPLRSVVWIGKAERVND